MMNRKFFFAALAFLFVGSGLIWFFSQQERGEEVESDNKLQSIKDAYEWEFERTKDLTLGYPPVERLLLALEQTQRRQAKLRRHTDARRHRQPEMARTRPQQYRRSHPRDPHRQK
ncbi:MAG: hypothetical protein IPJ40_22650 [Saprospirales bacterium]|nr:hypothetical protein [Saprospirales bacterium]